MICIVYDPATGDVLTAFFGRQENEADYAANWAAHPGSARLWVAESVPLRDIDRLAEVVDGKLVWRKKSRVPPKPEPPLDTLGLIKTLVETLDAEGVLAKDKLPQRAKAALDD